MKLFGLRGELATEFPNFLVFDIEAQIMAELRDQQENLGAEALVLLHGSLGYPPPVSCGAKQPDNSG